VLKKLSIPVLLVFLLSITSFGPRGKVNFSGEWKLDREKTTLSEGRLYLSKIKISQEKDILQTTRTYTNQNGEQYPFDEEITVDGEEREIVIYEMKRRTAAKWSEDGKSLIIKSITKYWGDSGEEEFSIDETWDVDKKGNVLSIDYTTNSVWGTNTGTSFFNKAEE
jgi:hypothetical protein